MATPAIVVQDLAKRYPQTSLEAISFHISAGEYFVLCGASGAGKSTLLRLLAGLETPTHGKIFFHGREIQTWPAHQRGVAWVPQRAALYPHRDVGGNIALALELEQRSWPRTQRRKPAEIAAKVDEAAQRLRLDKVLRRRPEQLSGGEAKRVMLAQAIVRDAPIWLLDEPLGQLDGPLAAELSQELHLLQRLLSRTIIHVTHDPNEALALADRVGLLGGGRLLQTGTPSEILAQPSSRTVGLLFGSPPMQFFDGVADHTWFTTPTLRVPNPPACGILSLGVRPSEVGFVPQPGSVILTVGVPQIIRPDGRRWFVQVNGVTGWWDDDLPPTNAVPVVVSAERLHWFAADGQRLAASSKSTIS